MATTYTETDNIGLDLYGDNDPADLRDGYNSSMRKIDSAIKANTDALAAKANKSDVYTMAQSDAALALKADKSDVYTKAEVDSLQAARDTTIAAKADASIVPNAPVADVFMTMFQENNGMQAYFALSHDGVSFTPSSYMYIPSDGSGVRDPSVVWFGGQYWLYHTRIVNGQIFGVTNTIGVASSDDGQTFTTLPAITPPAPSSPQRVWAPDAYVEDGVLYLFYASNTDGNNGSFRTYCAQSTDGVNFTGGQDVGINTGEIDMHVVGKDRSGTYHAFTSTTADNRIIHYTSRSLTSGWQRVGDFDTTWPRGEGPASFPLKNGGWRLIVDCGGFVSPYTSNGLFYADCNNDFTQHTQLYPLNIPGKHVGCLLLNNTGDASARRTRLGRWNCYGSQFNHSGDMHLSLSAPETWTRVTWLDSELRGGMDVNSSEFIIPDDGCYLITADLFIHVNTASGATQDANWLNMAIATTEKNQNNVQMSYRSAGHPEVQGSCSFMGYQHKGDTVALWIKGGVPMADLIVNQYSSRFNICRIA